YVGNETSPPPKPEHPNELFRNNGDGTFTDVAAAAGVASTGFVKGLTWGDYDNDGKIDLYLSHLKGRNALFHNREAEDGAVRFAEVAETAGVQAPSISFPTWFWDYDNDGWQDLFVAGFDMAELGDMAAVHLDLPFGAEHAHLYRNAGDGTFREVSAEVGLDRIILVMGANFGDLDNDGWLDAYFGTGMPDMRTLLPNRMVRNDGGRRFQDVTASGGFGHLQKGHGISFGDLDHDGD
ncbi:MAG: VCBS repeat-containing protein, partial [Planctomycetota bacterium]|nr:VCBS repeat-containing protein [Planctomycetota bacterium]